MAGSQSSEQRSLHRARQPVGERLLQILQRQAARRVPQWRDLLQPEGSQGCDPAMAQALQHDQTALIPELSTASIWIRSQQCNSLYPAGPKHPSGHQVQRLIVNMPPRNLKSLTFNVALSAFLLGHDPRKRIFCISYGGELSSEHAAQFRAIVQSEWYQRIFPRMRIGAWSMTRSIRPSAAFAVGPRSWAP